MAKDSNINYREYLDNIQIELRQLDCCEPDTEVTVFGRKLATPVITAAMSLMDKIRENGYYHLAKGAKDAGSITCLGMVTNEQLTETLTECPDVIHFIKPYSDRKKIYEEIDSSIKAGCFAVGMDIDHGYNRFGEPDFNGMMKGISSEELAGFTNYSKVPFIVKGVLSVTDAIKCKENGAAGVVVSHHHGIVDHAVAPIRLLPEIRKAVSDDMLIITDGIYDGADAFKALALGSDLVMVGRAILNDDFKEKGAEALTEFINATTRELKGFMAHTSCKSVKEINKSLLYNINR